MLKLKQGWPDGFTETLTLQPKTPSVALAFLRDSATVRMLVFQVEDDLLRDLKNDQTLTLEEIDKLIVLQPEHFYEAYLANGSKLRFQFKGLPADQTEMISVQDQQTHLLEIASIKFLVPSYSQSRRLEPLQRLKLDLKSNGARGDFAIIAVDYAEDTVTLRDNFVLAFHYDYPNADVYSIVFPDVVTATAPELMDDDVPNTDEKPGELELIKTVRTFFEDTYPADEQRNQLQQNLEYMLTRPQVLLTFINKWRMMSPQRIVKKLTFQFEQLMTAAKQPQTTFERALTQFDENLLWVYPICQVFNRVLCSGKSKQGTMDTPLTVNKVPLLRGGGYCEQILPQQIERLQEAFQRVFANQPTVRLDTRNNTVLIESLVKPPALVERVKQFCQAYQLYYTNIMYANQNTMVNNKWSDLQRLAKKSDTDTFAPSADKTVYAQVPSLTVGDLEARNHIRMFAYTKADGQRSLTNPLFGIVSKCGSDDGSSEYLLTQPLYSFNLSPKLQSLINLPTLRQRSELGSLYPESADVIRQVKGFLVLPPELLPFAQVNRHTVPLRRKVTYQPGYDFFYRAWNASSHEDVKRRVQELVKIQPTLMRRQIGTVYFKQKVFSVAQDLQKALQSRLPSPTECLEFVPKHVVTMDELVDAVAPFLIDFKALPTSARDSIKTMLRGHYDRIINHTWSSLKQEYKQAALPMGAAGPHYADITQCAKDLPVFADSMLSPELSVAALDSQQRALAITKTEAYVPSAALERTCANATVNQPVVKHYNSVRELEADNDNADAVDDSGRPLQNKDRAQLDIPNTTSQFFIRWNNEWIVQIGSQDMVDCVTNQDCLFNLTPLKPIKQHYLSLADLEKDSATATEGQRATVLLPDTTVPQVYVWQQGSWVQEHGDPTATVQKTCEATTPLGLQLKSTIYSINNAKGNPKPSHTDARHEQIAKYYAAKNAQDHSALTSVLPETGNVPFVDSPYFDMVEEIMSLNTLEAKLEQFQLLFQTRVGRGAVQGENPNYVYTFDGKMLFHRVWFDMLVQLNNVANGVERLLDRWKSQGVIKLVNNDIIHVPSGIVIAQGDLVDERNFERTRQQQETEEPNVVTLMAQEGDEDADNTDVDIAPPAPEPYAEPVTAEYDLPADYATFDWTDWVNTFAQRRVFHRIKQRAFFDVRSYLSPRTPMLVALYIFLFVTWSFERMQDFTQDYLTDTDRRDFFDAELITASQAFALVRSQVTEDAYNELAQSLTQDGQFKLILKAMRRAFQVKRQAELADFLPPVTTATKLPSPELGVRAPRITEDTVENVIMFARRYGYGIWYTLSRDWPTSNADVRKKLLAKRLRDPLMEYSFYHVNAVEYAPPSSFRNGLLAMTRNSINATTKYAEVLLWNNYIRLAMFQWHRRQRLGMAHQVTVPYYPVRYQIQEAPFSDETKAEYVNKYCNNLFAPAVCKDENQRKNIPRLFEQLLLGNAVQVPSIAWTRPTKRTEWPPEDVTCYRMELRNSGHMECYDVATMFAVDFDERAEQRVTKFLNDLNVFVPFSRLFLRDLTQAEVQQRPGLLQFHKNALRQLTQVIVPYVFIMPVGDNVLSSPYISQRTLYPEGYGAHLNYQAEDFEQQITIWYFNNAVWELFRIYGKLSTNGIYANDLREAMKKYMLAMETLVWLIDSFTPNTPDLVQKLRRVWAAALSHLYFVVLQKINCAPCTQMRNVTNACVIVEKRLLSPLEVFRQFLTVKAEYTHAALDSDALLNPLGQLAENPNALNIIDLLLRYFVQQQQEIYTTIITQTADSLLTEVAFVREEEIANFLKRRDNMSDEERYLDTINKNLKLGKYDRDAVVQYEAALKKKEQGNLIKRKKVPVIAAQIGGRAERQKLTADLELLEGLSMPHIEPVIEAPLIRLKKSAKQKRYRTVTTAEQETTAEQDEMLDPDDMSYWTQVAKAEDDAKEAAYLDNLMAQTNYEYALDDLIDPREERYDLTSADVADDLDEDPDNLDHNELLDYNYENAPVYE